MQWSRAHTRRCSSPDRCADGHMRRDASHGVSRDQPSRHIECPLAQPDSLPRHARIRQVVVPVVRQAGQSPKSIPSTSCPPYERHARTRSAHPLCPASVATLVGARGGPKDHPAAWILLARVGAEWIGGSAGVVAGLVPFQFRILAHTSPVPSYKPSSAGRDTTAQTRHTSWHSRVRPSRS